MKITDEILNVAVKAYKESPSRYYSGSMRAALEAAFNVAEKENCGHTYTGIGECANCASKRLDKIYRNVPLIG